MKEITRIHLAKTPYSVEVDAKKELEGYLTAIEKMMHAEPEAMQEIEARMVELLASRGVEKDNVVTLADVEALRTQMGEPKEFSEADDDTVKDKATEDSAASSSIPPVKRLMRDPDNALIGGVCAGVAAYWGINPLWIRIFAVISPFITFGTAVLIYVVMWVSMPEARTAAEKLQMRGQPVTLDSLKNFSMGEVTGRNLAGKTSRIMKRVIGVFTGLICLSVMAVGIIVLPVGLWFGFHFIGWLAGFAVQPWAVAVLMCLTVACMLLVVVSGLLAHAAFTWRIGRAKGLALIIMLIFGSLNMAATMIVGSQAAREFARDEQRLTKKIDIPLPDLSGVKTIVIEGKSWTLEDAASQQTVKAELHYLAIRELPAPQVEFDRQGDRLYGRVVHQTDRTCNYPQVMFGGYDSGACAGLMRRGEVVFSGPIKRTTYEHYEYMN